VLVQHPEEEVGLSLESKVEHFLEAHLANLIQRIYGSRINSSNGSDNLLRSGAADALYNVHQFARGRCDLRCIPFP
jgi:hypothetical protein